MSKKNSSVNLKNGFKDFQDLSKIFHNFKKKLNAIKEKNFVIAVSGGPDSMALAFLAKVYSIKNEIVPKFFIVDHNLRPESGKEAKLVKKVLKQFSINSEILKWRGKKPSKNIQSLARKKRYELLSNRCEKLKINNILLFSTLIKEHRNEYRQNLKKKYLW